jgi:hypothetical protein
MRTAPAAATATTTRKVQVAAAAAACERRVIFPTYPRNPPPPPQPTTTTTTTPATTLPREILAKTTLSLSLLPSSKVTTTMTTACDVVGTKKKAPRRVSVLPVIPSARTKGSARTAARQDVTTTTTPTTSSITTVGRSRTRRSSSSDDLLKHLLLTAGGGGGLPPTPTPGKSRRVLLVPPPNSNSNKDFHLPVLPPVKNEPHHRLVTIPASRSILSMSPKYSPRRRQTNNQSNRIMVDDETKSDKDSSLPSLREMQQQDIPNTMYSDDNGKDNTVSHSLVTSHDTDNTDQEGRVVPEKEPSVTTTTPTTVPIHPTTLSDETPTTTTITTTKVEAPCHHHHHHHVAFDPRIWIREFHREPEEATSTWYTDQDMDSFRRMAVERILHYQNLVEIIPTGTGRIIQRRVVANNNKGHQQQQQQPWMGRPIYSHAALTLDGNNRNDALMRSKVVEKELQTILVIDPHDLCCKLFAKALQSALPCATVVTVMSTAEALKHLAQQQEKLERFDMILVEERLQLFHHHHHHRQLSSPSSLHHHDDNDDDDGTSVSSTTSPLSSPGNNNTQASSSKSWLWSPDKIYNKDAYNDVVRVSAGSSCEAIMSSGAALIRTLRRFPSTSNSLLIGVTAHLKEDGPKLQESGADFCWSKPPPPFDQPLVDEMVKTLLIKRGQGVLASELFG